MYEVILALWQSVGAKTRMIIARAFGGNQGLFQNPISLRIFILFEFAVKISALTSSKSSDNGRCHKCCVVFVSV